ncbi:MAG TPA: ABC transporter substrate-binding protein [Pseudomonas sp.]|nr:ABC transporter substrate-binding protein [Pseudomonas sp.]
MGRKWIGGLLLAAFCSQVAAAPALTFCYEDQDSYPWVMTDGSGLNQALVDLVGQALGLEIARRPMPWKRCLAGLEQGLYDGAFAASYKAERLAMGAYPTRANGELDDEKRLHTSSYSLYRRVGDPVRWNGQGFEQLSGKIGSLSGFSIVDFLHHHGVEVEENSRDPQALLNMLKNGRIQAAALQSQRADFVLQAHPELAGFIEKTSPSLEHKAYYLMLSRQLLGKHPALATQVWNQIQRQRESAAYQAILTKTLAQPGS